MHSIVALNNFISKDFMKMIALDCEHLVCRQIKTREHEYMAIEAKS